MSKTTRNISPVNPNFSNLRTLVFILSLSLLIANLNLNAAFAQSLLVAGNNLSSNSSTISQPTSSNSVKPHDTVVTTCDEANFKQALAAGGYISFNCGPNPVTITFTSHTEAVVTQTNTVVDGGGLVTLSGDNATRVFSVTGDIFSGVNFTVKNISIINGNDTSGNGGGAIYNPSSQSFVTVINSTFQNNVAGLGGAIFNSGGLIVSNSSFISNTASNYGGGAVYITSNCGDTISITNSTIANNKGVGVVGVLTSMACSGQSGGSHSNNGLPQIYNSTLYNNATANIGGSVNEASIFNSILYDDLPNSVNCSYQMVDGSPGHNIEWPDNSCGSSFLQLDPKLGSLSNKGGVTPTIPLLAGSGAVSAADPSICVAAPVNNVDQRGVTRPTGYCSIGAYEAGNAYPIARLAVLVSSTIVSGSATSLQITLKNPTPQPFTNVAINDMLPPQLSYTGSAFNNCGSGNAAINNNNGELDISGVNLAASTSCTITADVTSGSPGIWSDVTGPTSSDQTGTGAVSNSVKVYVTATLVVTDCSSYGPNTGTLGAALTTLAAGGHIIFKCDGTITVPATIPVNYNLSLDATNQNVTLSGGNAVQLFTVTKGINFSLEHFNLTNGYFSNNNNFSDYGGGVLYSNNGIIAIDNSVFYDNFVTSTMGFAGYSNGAGGAIYNGGTMTVTNSSFYNNNTHGDGGAIGNSGTLTITNSSFYSNTASNNAGSILNSGNLTVANSTLSNNTALNGGATFNSGHLVLYNSTIYSNHAQYGGALFQRAPSPVTIINSTLYSNTSPNGDAVAVSQYLGLLYTKFITIENSIIASPVPSVNCVSYIQPYIVDGGNNLEYSGGITNTCGFTNNAQTGDPMLGPLQNNGGSTLTLALLPGSPAIDNGNDAVCSAAPVNSLDQRGVSRPVGAHCDIGAFEGTQAGPSSIAAIAGTPQSTQINTNFATPFQALVTDPYNNPMSGTIVTFTAPGTGASGIFTGGSSNVFTATTDASGIVTATTFTANSVVGSYPVTATIAGVITPATFVLTNAAIATTASLTSAPNPSVYGQPITFTANVSPITATGTVTLKLNSSPIYTATLDSSADVASSYVTNTLSAGVYTATASYNGDNNYAATISNIVTQTINKDNSNIQLEVNPTTTNLNQDIIYTATVKAASTNLVPTGSVIFSDTTTGTAIGTANLNSNGVAVFDNASNGSQYLNGGSHNIEALYNGDSNYNGNTSTSVTVNINSQSVIAVTSSANPATFGQSVIFTATVFITSTGHTTSPNTLASIPQTVTFSIDGTTVAQNVAVVSGVATYITSSLSVGQHNVVATYTGGNNEQNATSAIYTQTVNPANTATNLLSSATAITQGQSVTFTATVSAVAPGSGTPTGSVIFTDTTTNIMLGTVSIGGNNNIAAFTVTNLAVGNHTIKATYSGSDSFNSSAATTTVTVNRPPPPITPTVTLSGSASVVSQGQNIAFIAAVSGSNGTPSGTVSFYDNNTVFDDYFSLNNQGIVTINDNALSVGTHLITAIYNGNSVYGSASSNVLTITVNSPTSQTTPKITLVSSAGVIQQGQSLSFTATVTGSNSSNNLAPTGSINLMDGGTSLLSVVSLKNGVATYTTNSLSVVGSHSITAIYNGDSNFNSATSNAIAVTVNASSTNGYTYYLPFVANNANNFTTYLAFQNIGSTSANITVTYYDTSGNTLINSTLITQVAKYAEALPTNPFASGKQGTGIITSDQPLNVIVPEATPYGGSAYAVSSGSSNSLIAPFALNNAFGDFTTQLDIFNGGSSAATATVTFYGTVGNSTTLVTSTTSVNISPFTTFNLNQNTLPSGFSGWAQITGSTNSLVAQVLEQSPSTKFVAIGNAIANPSTTEYAPAIFKNGYGSFYTGENIINPNSSAVTVTVTYYDLSANATPTTPFTIPGYGVASIFNGASGGNGVPNGGLPNNFIGSVAVSSVGGPIAMSVNENGGVTSAGNSRSGTYAAIASGGSTVGLPVVSNGGFTYTTGDTILNTSSQSVTGTISYYNTDGTPVGVSKTFTIAGHGSEAYYQGDGSLTSGFYGTAVITETSSPANSLVVTTNAQNIALFYTYSEPNS